MPSVLTETVQFCARTVGTGTGDEAGDGATDPPGFGRAGDVVLGAGRDEPPPPPLLLSPLPREVLPVPLAGALAARTMPGAGTETLPGDVPPDDDPLEDERPEGARLACAGAGDADCRDGPGDALACTVALGRGSAEVMPV